MEKYRKEMQTKLDMYKNMNVIIERQSRLDKYVTGKTTFTAITEIEVHENMEV